MKSNLVYRFRKPNLPLSGYVDSFWMLTNTSDLAQEVVLLPDGRIDVFFSKNSTSALQMILLGLDTFPSPNTIAANSTIFAISFKLLAAEYLLKHPVAEILNSGTLVNAHFLDLNLADLTDFDSFCHSVTAILQRQIPQETDLRKQRLFQEIHRLNGAISIAEMATEVGWSSRQIHRYFTSWFGLSLKLYCDILRFRSAFEPIHAGELFPEGNYSDQSHFIRQIKKFSGVIPKELNKNKNDRFIQLSDLTLR